MYLSEEWQYKKKLCKIIFLPARPVTAATIELYYSVVINMLPTPSKMHYQFNLHDISKVRDNDKRTAFL
jgi:dynein heavy chain